MKRRALQLLALMLVVPASFGTAQANPAPLDPAAATPGLQPIAAISNRLTLGARVCFFALDETRRRGENGLRNENGFAGNHVNYIGSLWGLEEIQDPIPRLYLQWTCCRYLGLGLTYDHVAAKTLDWKDASRTETQGDGDLQIRGPLAYLYAQLPNSSRLTPLAELGLAYYFADFCETEAWAHTGPGYRFEVDDTVGYYFALGTDLAITRCWHCDFYWRFMYGPEVDARAYFHPGNILGREGSFPMEYQMAGFGVSYHF